MIAGLRRPWGLQRRHRPLSASVSLGHSSARPSPTQASPCPWSPEAARTSVPREPGSAQLMWGRHLWVFNAACVGCVWHPRVLYVAPRTQHVRVHSTCRGDPGGDPGGTTARPQRSLRRVTGNGRSWLPGERGAPLGRSSRAVSVSVEGLVTCLICFVNGSALSSKFHYILLHH